MANEEQARYWGEEGGPRWVASEADHDLMLEPFGAAVVEALAPQPGERVLDVGCGFGATTAAVAKAVGPSGRVVGIDISAPMIERARARLAQSANGTAPVELVVGDAQTDDLRGPHDAVVSRFGMMFFADTPAAIAHISGAVRPGGRMAFVCWRDMSENPWYALPNSVIVGALPEPPPLPAPMTPSPFGFGNIAVVTELMADGRLGGHRGRPLRRRRPPRRRAAASRARSEHARTTLAGRLLFAQLPAERAEQVMGDVRAVLAHYEDDGVVRLPAAAWIVTARRP